MSSGRLFEHGEEAPHLEHQVERLKGKLIDRSHARQRAQVLA
jgi:hypothetical protein